MDAVRAFGSNASGQTSLPDLDGNRVVQAAAGYSHTVLVLEDGSVRAFGGNEFRQTTLPDLDGNKVMQAAAGFSHTVLVLEDGSVRAFGHNGFGQTTLPDLDGNKVMLAAACNNHNVLVLKPNCILTLTLTANAIVVLNMSGEVMGSYKYCEEATVAKIRFDMSAKTGLTARQPRRRHAWQLLRYGCLASKH